MDNRKLKYGSLIQHNDHSMTHGENIMSQTLSTNFAKFLQQI